MAGYLLRKRLAGERFFPLVLMLEPLHACNLACAGCGRAREYADVLHQRLSIAQCLSAVEECGAPIVSICGGEPLIYPQIELLVRRLLQRGKHIYLCTNGLLLEKKLPDLPPHKRFMLNVHLDGMEPTHDRLAGRSGVFAAATAGIRTAKAAGFQVCTNTTIYRETDMHEIAVLFTYLEQLGVDGLMLSPAYGYASVCEGKIADSSLFLTRSEIHEKFRAAAELLRHFRLTATPLYGDFLCGKRRLPCAAWANPTYNVRGWRGPCYLLGDRHYASYKELIAATDWSRFGHEGDPRCAHCLVHYGFEPAALFQAGKSFRDALRLALWQLR